MALAVSLILGLRQQSQQLRAHRLLEWRRRGRHETLDRKASAQTHHIGPCRLAGQVVLRQAVNLTPDQVAGHRSARPSFGDHGTDGSLLEASQRAADAVNLCRWWVLFGIEPITAVQSEMLCAGQRPMAQHSVKLRAGLQPQQDLARPDSDGQALAAFGAACIDHGAAAAGAHASQKAMGAGTLDFGRLVSAFHDLSLKNRYLQVFEPLGHSATWWLGGPSRCLLAAF